MIEKMERRERFQVLFLTIHGVLSVKTCRAKSESSSTRRGLHVWVLKRRDFIEDPKEEISGDQIF